MSPLQTVLVVDDDPMPRLVVTSTLKSVYRVVEADNGLTGLTLAQVEKPSLILMDIRMPEMDGYEACRQLKANEDTRNIPVIFVSSELTLADRLAAYDAGGEDFVGKPAAPEELRSKVAITIKNVIERQRLESNVQEAFQAAMAAMSTAGELGVVINALRQSFNCNDLPTLAESILASCSDYGLDACIHLVTRTQTYVRSCHGAPTPVELGVLDKLSQGDRIMSLGRQTACHFGGLTLLVRNMPVHDPDAAGRMRDNLALIAEGCETRLRALEAEAFKEGEQAQRSLFIRAAGALRDIQHRHESQKHRTELVLNSMLSEIEATFVGLGLTDRQEAIVSKLLRGTAERISELYAEGLNIEEHLTSIGADAQQR